MDDIREQYRKALAASYGEMVKQHTERARQGFLEMAYSEEDARVFAEVAITMALNEQAYTNWRGPERRDTRIADEH